jgi:hypothetical protein
LIHLVRRPILFDGTVCHLTGSGFPLHGTAAKV